MPPTSHHKRMRLKPNGAGSTCPAAEELAEQLINFERIVEQGIGSHTRRITDLEDKERTQDAQIEALQKQQVIMEDMLGELKKITGLWKDFIDSVGAAARLAGRE